MTPRGALACVAVALAMLAFGVAADPRNPTPDPEPISAVQACQGAPDEARCITEFRRQVEQIRREHEEGGRVLSEWLVFGIGGIAVLAALRWMIRH